MSTKILGLVLGCLLMVLSGWLPGTATIFAEESTAVQAVAGDEAELSAAVAQLSGDEAHLLAWVNLMRSHASSPALVVDQNGQQVARERSQDMAARSYFSHTTPEGQNVLMMLPARGVNYQYAGETLQRNNFPAEQTVHEAIASLMDSPAHRDILLDPRFSHVGLGHAVDGDMHYFTVIVIQY